ncbi:AbgT family transporter [Chitinilyticum aquatile]|uniref:AbgT family transporter n=1 Tax=Chitinilyticum aquatile TaxID=362520 RepID=UPI000406182E|nr:AbgT family transporter [Chitinilyticum aquatile]
MPHSHVLEPTPARPASLTNRLLDGIERVGNALPDPVTLFVLLCLVVVLGSHWAASTGMSVIKPGTDDVITPVSLLSAATLQQWLVDAPKHFATFPPLATVLVALIGVGVAERSGLLGTVLARIVMCAPRRLMTPIVVLVGIMSNLASDVGYVVVIPLAAMIFASAGRHPLAGLAAAFAGTSAGFSANLLVSTLDPLLGGLTEAAAHLIDPAWQVSALANYYFMAASAIALTAVAWYVTDRIVEPRLPQWQGNASAADTPQADAASRAAEQRGLRAAGLVALLTTGLLLALWLPEGGILRDPVKGTLLPSPFINGIVVVIMVVFLLPGIAYGLAAGSISNDRDVARAMGDSLSEMGYYLVMVFFAAQFIALFGQSKLGVLLAVNGAEAISASGLSGMPLLLTFVLFTAAVNLVIGSASAKWALLAPIFVPMLMLLGFTPEATQLAYRIGDSVSNIISPMMVYFPIVLVMAKRYLPEYGLGSLITLMLPYSLAFTLAWSLLMTVWIGLDIPIGPGIAIHLPAALH